MAGGGGKTGAPRGDGEGDIPHILSVQSQDGSRKTWGGVFWNPSQKLLRTPRKNLGAEMSMESPRIVWYMKDGITNELPPIFLYGRPVLRRGDHRKSNDENRKRGVAAMAAKKRRADMTEEERRKQTEAATRKNAIFETAEEFEEAIRGYFDYCDLNDILYNDAGMCLWLSDHNKKGRKVTLQTLERWWDGTSCPYLQESTQLAYLHWQNQFFTNPVYLSKNGVSLSVFMQKQKRLGGRKDRTDANIEQTVNVNFGKNMDENDFK